MSSVCDICHPEEYDERHHPDPRGECESASDSEWPSDLEDGSDDEGASDDSNNEEHLREIRSAKSTHRPRQGHHGKNGAMAKSKVMMPTGKLYSIPAPALPKWRCKQWSKLVTLNQKGGKTAKEYNIVANQMEKTNTIVDYTNCENSGGGCFEHYRILKIRRIIQGCAWRRYQARKRDVEIENGSANERMLFHGSDAVWKIVRGGFDERYASTNGQFGAGLYFARHSSLANQFVFGYFGGNGCPRHHDKNCYICIRHLLLCRVTLGKPKLLSTLQNMAHPPVGHHSVEAVASSSAFKYPEYVVYRGEQAYPEYIISYKILRPDDRNDGADDAAGDE